MTGASFARRQESQATSSSGSPSYPLIRGLDHLVRLRILDWMIPSPRMTSAPRRAGSDQVARQQVLGGRAAEE